MAPGSLLGTWTTLFMIVSIVSVMTVTCQKSNIDLVLDEDFNELDFSLWKHEITLSGGGNWEFQAYTNNRSNSYVREGVLYIQPTLMSDDIGEAAVVTPGSNLDYWVKNVEQLLRLCRPACEWFMELLTSQRGMDYLK